VATVEKTRHPADISLSVSLTKYSMVSKIQILKITIYNR